MKKASFVTPILILIGVILILSSVGVSEASTSVAVTANPLWTDTGLTVNTGDTVSITASGIWNSGLGPIGPDGGDTTCCDWDLFLANPPALHGELIAFVGSDPYQGHWGDGTFFPQTAGNGYWGIGSSGSFISDRNGELWLGINDDAVSKAIGDNSGSLTALINIFTATKDFRFTDVNFVPIDPVTGKQLPAILGDLLPDANANGKYDVKYVLKPKDGTVSSTNPGQLYGVTTITGAGVDKVHMEDTFGTQFVVNPAKRGGGVEILRIDAAGLATALTDDLVQVPTVVVANNGAGPVTVDIDLASPLGAGEKLMIYIKYQTALKGQQPDTSDFVNTNLVTINGGTDIQKASATIEFV